MAISYKTGNLLDDDAEILVCTTNTKGVMGAGIALAFKQKFPDMFQEYRTSCIEGFIKAGTLWWYHRRHKQSICCFSTKDHWKNPSKLEWIENGLKELRLMLWFFIYNNYPSDPIKSIAIPKLGCANGGLNWDDVRPLIIKYLGDLDCDVRIYV